MLSLAPQRGFTLLEVVVSMVILTVGLLGVASVQMVSLQDTNTAYLRSQSVLISDDLIERLRNNPTLLAYAITTGINSSNFNGATESAPIPGAACQTDAGCTGVDLRNAELNEWVESLKRVGDISKPTTGSAPVQVTMIYDTAKKLFNLKVQWKNKQWTKDTTGKEKRTLKSTDYSFLVAIN